MNPQKGTAMEPKGRCIMIHYVGVLGQQSRALERGV